MRRIALLFVAHTLMSMVCPITMAAAATFVPEDARMCPAPVQMYQSTMESATISAPCQESHRQQTHCLTIQGLADASFPSSEQSGESCTRSVTASMMAPVILSPPSFGQTPQTADPPLTTVVLRE